MKYYVVIDTNVLVSAMLKWHSVPGSIVELVFEGLIVQVFNQAILKEYRDVLSRPKFRLTEDIVDDVINSFMQAGFKLDAEPLDIVLPDPKDVVFYEVVMEERKNEDAYLVTGNIKHFPSTSYVVTPRQMLNIILNDEERG